MASPTSNSFSSCLHDRGQTFTETDEEKTHCKITPHSCAYFDACPFAKSKLDEKVREFFTTMSAFTKLIKLRKVIGIVRAFTSFTFMFAITNLSLVAFAHAFESAPRTAFIRFGMTMPGSISICLNSLCIFLLTYLIEKLHTHEQY